MNVVIFRVARRSWPHNTAGKRSCADIVYRPRRLGVGRVQPDCRTEPDVADGSAGHHRLNASPAEGAAYYTIVFKDAP